MHVSVTMAPRIVCSAFACHGIRSLISNMPYKHFLTQKAEHSLVGRLLCGFASGLLGSSGLPNGDCSDYHNKTCCSTPPLLQVYNARTTLSGRYMV